MKYLLALSASTLLLAQTQTLIPNGAPASHVFDGQIAEWKDLPPTFTLRSTTTTGSRKARIWVRQVPEGLLIAGEVLGAAPDFPAEESEMLNKDHVEIWLAPENLPKLPKPGWSNMLGPVRVDKRQDCIDYVKKQMPGMEQASCDAWLAEVAAHRPLVSRLLVRQYSLSPSVVVETYARPAWEHIAHDGMNRDREWGPLNPKELPSFKTAVFEGGYAFESIVPWEAMPPLTSLDLKSMRLMVDVFSAHAGPPKNQPFSTSSPLRKYGYPSTMNLVKLAVGRKFWITACEYPLAEEYFDAGLVPGFFRPAAHDEVMRVMTLVNAYGHRSFAAEGESPALRVVDHWQQELAGSSPSVTACGPRLAVRDGQAIHRFRIDADQTALSALAQPDGGYLVKSGPTVSPEDIREKYDPCFQCRVVDLYILRVGPQGEPRTLLELHEPAGSESMLLDRDIHVNADWSRVTIYRETSHEPPEWESETLCREGFEYNSCGKNSRSGPPPSPRAVTPFEPR